MCAGTRSRFGLKRGEMASSASAGRDSPRPGTSGTFGKRRSRGLRVANCCGRGRRTICSASLSARGARTAAAVERREQLWETQSASSTSVGDAHWRRIWGGLFFAWLGGLVWLNFACTLLACDSCGMSTDINGIRISKVTRRNLRVHQGDFVTVNFMFNVPSAQQIHISPFEDTIDGIEGDLFTVQ